MRQLLTDHGGTVRSTLRREFHRVLDELSIDEAMSQATQRAWRSGHRFDPARGTLRAWFYVVARNCALRVLECRRRQAAISFVEDLDSAAIPAAPRAEDMPKQQSAFVNDLYRCIDKLPPQQRAVVLADLRAGGSAPMDILLDTLGTTRNSIYVARANARKTLRRSLQAMGHVYAVTDSARQDAP